MASEPTSGSTSDPALERMLDLFVYAPIGLLATSLESLPELADKGRAKASTAQAVGAFATTMGTRQMRASIEGLEQRVADVLSIVREAASPRRAASSPTAEARSTDTGSASSVDELVPDYDARPASEIVPLLSTFDLEQLDRLEGHELAGRARRTVLTRIAQRRSALQR